LKLALSLLLAFSLYAEESRSGTPKTLRTQVRVTTLDQDPTLDRAAFSARLDGNPAKVLRVLGPTDDLVLLLVLDLSGEPTLIDAAREALTEQLNKLPNNQWVGVMKAQDNLTALADPTPDRDKITTVIQDYAATGKAGLLTTAESMASLGHQLLDRSGIRVAVVYITDSNIYNYREDYTNPVINATDSRDLSRRFPDQLVKEKMQKISDQLARYETPFFIVHLNTITDPINEAYRRGLLQLTEESGGLSAFCRSRGEISTAIEKVIAAAANHWSVAVELTRTKLRAVNVTLTNADRPLPNRTRFALGK